MTTIGVTGHQALPPQAEALLRRRLPGFIHSQQPPTIGVTSLAAGADQLFAELVLHSGAQLHVIIPCQHYEETFEDQSDQRKYFWLLKQAAQIEQLPYTQSLEEAFFAAGKKVADASDWLVAVWDRQPSRGLGGTGDVVSYAKQLGKRVKIIWPPGLRH